MIKMATRLEVENFSGEEPMQLSFPKAHRCGQRSPKHPMRAAKEHNHKTSILDLTDKDLRELIGPIGDCKALKSINKAYSPQTEVYLLGYIL